MARRFPGTLDAAAIARVDSMHSFDDVVPTYPGCDKVNDLPRCEGCRCQYGDEPKKVHDCRALGASPRHPCAQWCKALAREPVQHQAAGASQRSEEAAALKQIEEPGTGCSLSGGLFEAELIGPGDERAKEKLIVSQNHGQHGQHRPADGAQIAPVDGEGHIGADAGQADRVVAHGDRLGSDDEEPAARHGHHRVPNQAGSREWQLEPQEAQPRRHPEMPRHLVEIARDGPQ